MLDKSQETAIRLAARDKAQKAVGTVMGQTTIIRDLAAYDISGVAPGTQFYARLANKNALVARTWFINDFGTRTVPINTAVVILGYEALTPSPKIDAIAFQYGSGLVLAQFWLAPIYCELYSAVGYFDPPVLFGPQQTLNVNLLAESAVGAAAETYALLGYVAEPLGQTVSPDQTNLV
jgi:hypothetical protein